MDFMETDDQLTIVNRSKEHVISKQLIRNVPYFEKMLSLDLKESKENEVVLDFDEKTLKSFLNWLELGDIFIEMDYVIHLYNMLDYFGIKDDLLQDCINYFNDNFIIEHLPIVIPQVTPVSKLINSSHLNAFICRYFLKIADTCVFSSYPVETIEYICALDLMIDSEIQVFDAIMRWGNCHADSAKYHLEKLLTLVRWCYFKDKDLSKIEEKTQSLSFHPSKLCSSKKCDCDLTGNRTKQEHFIGIYKMNATSLRIIVNDNNFYPLMEKVIKLNNSMTIDVFPDEHVSDIFLDSGNQTIRIDWKRNEYRLLDESQCKTYCIKILNCIQESNCIALGFVLPDEKCLYKFRCYGLCLFEASEKFVLICDDFSSVESSPARAELVAKYFQTDGVNDFRATILDDNIYLLSESDFINLNIDTNKKSVIGLEWFNNRLRFENCLLTSRKANDDRVILIDKSTKDAFSFNVNTSQWSSMGRFGNCNRKFPDVQDSTNKLLTLTSAFISLDTMRTCFAHNANSKK
ncbi:uncharacterized protein LOC107370822 [Tetranychus urticae]|uniref:BACK domain-containing protein n=1 Tax=Tetranychus urticae TaxID=32264 RepID=T1JXM1_TETUR|nr:uncharacterized protein LOC107370822 [Tetranychus urticae]